MPYPRILKGVNLSCACSQGLPDLEWDVAIFILGDVQRARRALKKPWRCLRHARFLSTASPNGIFEDFKPQGVRRRLRWQHGSAVRNWTTEGAITMELGVVRRAVKVARMASASARALPDFVIVGAQKAGTTSLFAYLADHPDLVSSSPKEIHYFDGGLDPEVDTYALGEKWYRSHFPLKVALGKGKMTFEASPLYLCNPLCAERIRCSIPNTKIIAVLRNPTDRAISHYFHERRRGQEPLSIMEAFYAEDARLAAPLAASEYKNHSFIHHTYKFRGRYAEQLPRYFDAFGRENVLVIDAGSFFRQPGDLIREVCSFLSVREFSLKEAPVHNVGKNRQALEAGVRDYLSRYFNEYNEELFDLLGERYNWS